MFRYDHSGLVDDDRFRSTLAAVLTATGVRKSPRHRILWTLAVCATSAFVIGLLPLLGLAIPVFSETVPLPRWSHWEHPAYWPGLAHVANPGAVAVAAFGVTTWFLLLLAALRIPTMWFLFVIQTLALLAAPVGMLDY